MIVVFFLHVFAYVDVGCLEVKGRTQAKGIVGYWGRHFHLKVIKEQVT